MSALHDRLRAEAEARSVAYQETIQSLNDEAVMELQEALREFTFNWLLGAGIPSTPASVATMNEAVVYATLVRLLQNGVLELTESFRATAEQQEASAAEYANRVLDRQEQAKLWGMQ